MEDWGGRVAKVRLGGIIDVEEGAAVDNRVHSECDNNDEAS